MGDDEAAKHPPTQSRSKSFLSRSKWGKVLKEDDSSKSNAFKLNEDVVDFLKPSTEKAASMRPKLNLSITTKQVEDNDREDVIAGDEDDQVPVDVYRPPKKKRRREGLRVGFTETEPEVMGEGGDECPYATIEVSRLKARAMAARTMQGQTQSAENTPRYDRMLQTQQTWPAHAPEPNRPQARDMPRQQQPRPPPPSIPQLRVEQSESPSFSSNIDQANSPVSIHAHRLRAMASNEGMSFRRASAIMTQEPETHNETDDSDDDNDPPPHFGPSSTLAPLPHRFMPSRDRPGDRAVSQQESPDTPLDGPIQRSRSPFDDPKYIVRHAEQSEHAKIAPRKEVPTYTNISVKESPDTPQQYPGQATYTPYRNDGDFEESPRIADDRQPTLPVLLEPKRAQPPAIDQATYQALERPAASPEVKKPPPVPQVQPRAAATEESSDAALSDFAQRVAHMRGVFQLTAEKEKPAASCSPTAWLRTACWWYLEGKTSLGSVIQRRQRGGEPPGRELLLQGHVDLAKAWWILNDPLHDYALSQRQQDTVTNGCETLLKHLRLLCSSIGKSQIMPPAASLIQGQDTRIWLSNPNMSANFAASLRDLLRRVNGSEDSFSDPLLALPLSDTRALFCYARFPVTLGVNASLTNGSVVPLPCMLSVLRSPETYQNTIIIGSQDDLVNVVVGPSPQTRIHWGAIRWQNETCSLLITPNADIMLDVRLNERDFDSLRRMIDYTRRVEKMLLPSSGENLKHEAALATLDYDTASVSPRMFPPGPVQHCKLALFSRNIDNTRYRLTLATEPAIKLVSFATHDLNEDAIARIRADIAARTSAASVTIALPGQGTRLLARLSFEDEDGLQAFQNACDPRRVPPPTYAAIRDPPSYSSPVTSQSDAGSHAHDAGRNQRTLCSVGLSNFEILPADFHANEVTELRDIGPDHHWRHLEVLAGISDERSSVFDRLHILIDHDNGQCEDNVRFDKGELLFRLPCSMLPVIHMFRWPQRDFEIFASKHPQPVKHDLQGYALLARQKATIRSYRFTDMQALYDFQAAITSMTVLYDGVANTFAISRRRLVVPIHHKWTANKVRLQIVANAKKTVVQILAFMDGFEHTEAMCFQIKSTDVFERIKGDGKGKDWGVKMVDAKFSLQPGTTFKDKFVNLDGLVYADQHDDITVGFESEKERDLFAQSLPAATTVGRMITLRRRI